MFQNMEEKNFLTMKMQRTFLSEKKLMPMIVLSASIIYIGIAATFYFDLHWIWFHFILLLVSAGASEQVIWATYLNLKQSDIYFP